MANIPLLQVDKMFLSQSHHHPLRCPCPFPPFCTGLCALCSSPGPGGRSIPTPFPTGTTTCLNLGSVILPCFFQRELGTSIFVGELNTFTGLSWFCCKYFRTHTFRLVVKPHRGFGEKAAFPGDCLSNLYFFPHPLHTAFSLQLISPCL